MQGGEVDNAVSDKMNHSSSLCETANLSQKSATDEGLSLMPHLAAIPPSGKFHNLPKEVLHQHQAILAQKYRLSKLLSRETIQHPRKDDEDLKGDIRVLSPSLVNSQVLPKTRPLSPLSPIKADLQNENLNSTKIRWKESGTRRKQERGKEDLDCTKDQEPTKSKGRGRRRPRIFKLKFHHQALPPEYLDHYEASLRQENKPFLESPDIRETKLGPRETLKEGFQPVLRKNKSERNQRNSRPITIHESGGAATEALLRDILLASPHLQQAAMQQAAIARAQSVPSVMLASIGSPQRMSYHPPSYSPDSSVGGEDRSSYASDMSIDDCPKRTRKPKKSEANLLMGRGLGSMGLNNSGVNFEVEKSSSQMTITEDSSVDPTLHNHENCNYSSVLFQNEPLNLCVRDESIKSPLDDRIKCEPIHKERRRTTESVDDSFASPQSESTAWNFGGGYLTPHWIHDYRLKTEDGLSSGQSTPSLCSQSSHMPCMSPPTWPHLSPPQISSPHSPVPPLSPLVPQRHIHALLKESLQERLSPHLHSPKLPHYSPAKSGARRKRSALFIPPADPTTQVSICKFKFTGGANPMLEEKKMVSVDSGGTLRYFNGGNKDKFNVPHRSIGGKHLDTLSKCEKDVKKIRLESDTDDTCSLPGGGIEPCCSSVTTSPTGTLEYGTSQCSMGLPIEDSPKRKRRSKKSSVRVKLEQTLRERGLLIQTQQVESAEGATYCKFRRLKKITRYLFRNWKDYLPSNEGEHPHDMCSPSPAAYEPGHCPPDFEPSLPRT